MKSVHFKIENETTIYEVLKSFVKILDMLDVQLDIEQISDTNELNYLISVRDDTYEDLFIDRLNSNDSLMIRSALIALSEIGNSRSMDTIHYMITHRLFPFELEALAADTYNILTKRHSFNYNNYPNLTHERLFKRSKNEEK